MEEIYKVKLESTNSLKDCAYSSTKNEYIDLTEGYILVKKGDLNYLFDNFKVISVEYVGNLFSRNNLEEK